MTEKCKNCPENMKCEHSPIECPYGERVPDRSQSADSLADITLEEAEVLAKKTDYAFDLCDCDGLNPADWADASAFFLEGYLYAKKQANELVHFSETN